MFVFYLHYWQRTVLAGSDEPEPLVMMKGPFSDHVTHVTAENEQKFCKM